MQVSQAREQEIVTDIRDNPARHVTFPGVTYRPDWGILISREGRRVLLHRWLWKQIRGPLDRNEFLIRTCEKVACQNPFHFTASRSPHGIEAAPKAADPVQPLDTPHCPQGHPLTDDNVYESTDSNGHHHRKCKTCGILRAREQRARAKQRRNEQAIFQGAES